MNSKTKYKLSREEAERIFTLAKLGYVESVAPLGAGMFNAVYKVVADKKPYVVKIAPTADFKVMTYEKDLLNTEIMWYDIMSRKTTINVPIIYFKDTSKKNIPCDYFIMEFLEGETLNNLRLNTDERVFADKSLCKNVASLHGIESGVFGYVQNQLYDNWYDALRSFVVNCLDDLRAYGAKSRRGQKLLQYIDKNKELLKRVEGTAVNYDIWDLNMVGKRTDDGLKITWIDPERSFYGDPIFDFVCINMMKMSLADKKQSVDTYNFFAKKKIVIDNNTETRFAFSMGYLALIQETEKYYRFKKSDIGWWFDVISSSWYYKNCFKLLAKVSNN